MNPPPPLIIPPMPTRLPRPFSSSRGDGVNRDNLYSFRWKSYFPPLFTRGPEFETTAELSIAEATGVLARVLEAETTPHDRYEMRALLLPRSDGTTTFNIIFVRTDSDLGTPTADLDVDDALAREYMACDYIHHRYVSNSLMMPMERMPSNAVLLLNAAAERMVMLHAELLGFIVK